MGLIGPIDFHPGNPPKVKRSHFMNSRPDEPAGRPDRFRCGRSRARSLSWIEALDSRDLTAGGHSATAGRPGILGLQPVREVDADEILGPQDVVPEEGVAAARSSSVIRILLLSRLQAAQVLGGL